MGQITIDELTINHIKAAKTHYVKASGKPWYHDDTEEVYEDIMRFVKKFGIQIFQAYKMYDDLETSKIENGSMLDDYYLAYVEEEDFNPTPIKI